MGTSRNEAHEDEEQDVGFDAAMQRALDRLNASTSRVRRSLNELIDLRAIELGALQIVRKATEVQQVVDHAVRGFPLHERRRIVVECASPMTLFADAARLSRTVARLLDIALAASARGSRILVRIEHQVRHALISIVVNTGKLAPNVVRFVVDNERGPAREQRGDQLGMYVAHQAVEAHGGKLSAVELPGIGTRICVELPLPLSAVAPRLPSPRAGSAVLLVDDNSDQLAAFAKLLQADGMHAEIASSGQDALAKIERCAPDVLVVDGQMPDMTGADLIARARQLLPQLPVVVVTGYPPHHPSIASAVAASQGAYVAKPVDLAAFYRELAKVLAPTGATAI